MLLDLTVVRPVPLPRSGAAFPENEKRAAAVAALFSKTVGVISQTW